MSDPFTLLQVAPVFNLDASALHASFLRLVGAAHPDRFSDPLEQADALQQSAHLTDAYRTLSDPELRAKALLALRGGHTAGDDDRQLPPAMLMEVMEVREQLEQAVADDDAAELKRLRAWAESQRTSHLQVIAGLFDAADVDGGAVQQELNALRYVERMLEQMPGE